jgi:hypothetical protein
VRLAVLVVVPVVVFCVLALTARAAIYAVAILSALGHGSLTRQEAIPLYIIGGVVALIGGSVAALVCERWLLRAARTRTPDLRAVTRFTRTTSFIICVALVVVVPPLAREARFRSTAARVTSQAYFPSSRQSAISDLALVQSPRSFELLRRVALDEQDVPSVRRAAIMGLWHYPESLPVLVALAQDPNAEVRAAAGVVLNAFSSDQAAWAAIERLARDDSPVVRTQMIGLLQRSSDPRASGLLKELPVREAPGPVTYDRALAIVMDVNGADESRLGAIHTLAALKDERALAVFRTIVMGLEPEFVRPERETKFRDAARVAGTYITGNQQPDWMSAFDNEQGALFDAENMMRLQLHHRKMLGVFDPCLVPGAPCVPGREREALTSRPLVGYVGQFHAGPPVSPDVIAARKLPPTSVTSFAWVAAPETPFKTGIRGFCADDTARICFTRDGRMPSLVNGRCPDSVPVPGPVPGTTVPGECGISR